MSIISLTFHSIPSLEAEWKDYVQTTLIQLAENLYDAERYILSEVDSAMINEGSNTNLLLMFANDEKREDFMLNEFENIRERIESKFGDQVLIFKTFLNAMKMRV